MKVLSFSWNKKSNKYQCICVENNQVYPIHWSENRFGAHMELLLLK